MGVFSEIETELVELREDVELSRWLFGSAVDVRVRSSSERYVGRCLWRIRLLEFIIEHKN